MHEPRTLFLIAAFVTAAQLPSVWGASPRIFPAGQRPADIRLSPLKDLNGSFDFVPPASRNEWNQRASQVRQQILVSLGLWPMPSKTPLNATVHGEADQGDYTVEKVYFESLPGLYVTGSLYRPTKPATGQRPAVLCPHGHWADGRFYEASVAAVRKLIVQGAERFEDSGRNHLQARCVQLARMGCVVFQYDMIGYADNTQLSFQLAHRFAKQRTGMNRAEGWGLFSPRAEAHLQSVMGLQTLNSIRALDFVCSLPDVDQQRIAVTGASGGGTQTFILSALDPRVSVSVPAVMVSTAMQGGCTCENACLLRVGTGNVEFAALFAPKPLCLLAADDWTREMPAKGFPELKALYESLGASGNVALHALLHFPHNYNQVGRAAMYRWLNRYLKLGHPEPIVEQDFPRLKADELTVWSAAHPRPKGGDEFERTVLQWWADDTQRSLAASWPQDKRSLAQYQHVVGSGVQTVIGRQLTAADDLEFKHVSEQDDANHLTISGLLRNHRHGEEVPICFLHPKRWNQRVVIWLSQFGKDGLFAANGIPRPYVGQLVRQGYTVVGVDLLLQGEFLASGEKLVRTRRVENPREAACYTFGYNPSLFAKRVHDVLSVISFVSSHKSGPLGVDLVGLDRSGHWAAAALSQAGNSVHRAAIDTFAFRFADVAEIHSPDFLPGGARYHDLPGMLSLAAGRPLWLDGEAELPPLIAAAHRAAGSTVKIYDGPRSEQPTAAANWLTTANR